MFCKYCGKEIKESSKFCGYCGEFVATSNHTINEVEKPTNSVVSNEVRQTTAPIKEEPNQDFLNHASHKASKPKVKKYKFLLGFVSSMVLFLVLIGISFGSIFFGGVDYQSMMGKVPRNWHVYTERIYEETDETITTTIDVETLNAYINSREGLKTIDVAGYKILNICLDSRLSKVYLRVKKGNMPEVNLVADYTVSLNHNALNFKLTPTEIGWNFPVISPLMLQLNYDIESIRVPLNTELIEVEEGFFVDYLSGKEGLGQIKKGDLVVEYDISNAGIDQLARSIGEVEFVKPEVINSNDEKYIEIKEDYLVSSLLLDQQVLDQLAKENIKGEYLINQYNQVLLRMNDQVSGLYYDINLSFEYDLDQDNLKLKNAKYHPLNQLSEDSMAVLKSAFDVGFSGKQLGLKDLYTITRTDYQDDILKLFIDQSSWTVLVYMNGSDLESSNWNGSLLGMASIDLNEMMAGVDDSRVNVIVETGGTLEWSNPNIDETQNQRWHVTGNELVHLEDLGKKNMCEPETLEDFLSYGISNYPADNYALVFWNHGGGAVYGFGYDEYFPYDTLTLDEMVTAFDAVENQFNFKFEVIGFDACLMATVETAITLEPYANYLIASEETEPDYGWDYEYVFGNLSDGTVRNGEDFGEIVVAGFREDSVTKNMEDVLTLSVIDLTKTDALVEAIDNLFAEINVSYDGLVTVNETIPMIKAFGGNTESSGYTDHYDLEHFAKKLIEFWPNEANELIEAINDSVKYKFTGYLATDAGGLSFYLPYYDLYSETNIVNLYEPIAISDTYFVFLEDFFDYRALNINATSEIEYTVNYEVDPYTITFTPETYDQIQWIYLNAYEVLSDDYGYYYLDLGYDAWAFETDDLYTYEDGFGKWAAIDGAYMPLKVTYDSDTYIEYETPILLNGEKAMMITAYLYDEGVYVIYGARPFNENSTGVIVRNFIEFQPDDEIMMIYDLYDDYGWLDYYYSNPIYVGSTGVPIIEEIQFEVGYTYGVQFVIVDVNDSITYTEYMEFSWN